MNDPEAIARASAALLAAVNGSDVDGVLAVWHADGTMMPPHQPAVRGHAALRAYFAKLFEKWMLRFQFTSSSVHIEGDLAFERLTYKSSSIGRESREERQDAGKGLHVYRREADGTWKLFLDIWNSDVL